MSSLQEALLLISGCQDESPARVPRVLPLCGSDGLSRCETCGSCGAPGVPDGNGVREKPPSVPCRQRSCVYPVSRFSVCSSSLSLLCFPRGGKPALAGARGLAQSVVLLASSVRLKPGSGQAQLSACRGALLSVSARTSEKPQEGSL